MNSAFQMTIWALIAIASTGLQIWIFNNQRGVLIAVGSLLWIIAVIHIAIALWIHGKTLNCDWIDRIGILIRGAGFAGVAFALFMAPGIVSIAMSVLGLLIAVFGRQLWELATITYGRKQ